MRTTDLELHDVVCATLCDLDRLCPALAGAICIRGNCVTVRLPEGDVHIKAESRLLHEVFDRCTGLRSVNQILADMTSHPLRDEFERFMHFLLAEGVLVDANLLTSTTAQYAWQKYAVGKSASAVLTGRIARRFAKTATDLPARDVEPVKQSPIGDLCRGRISSHTFGEEPVSQDALQALLWSLCGIVSDEHERRGEACPRRTIASAGALYLLQAFVVLKRAVGQFSAGVYAVEYPAEHAVVLRLLSAEAVDLLPRAMVFPDMLCHATGAIFVLGDVATAALRYRNRALQYLFMEAGAALQNASLSAVGLDLGFCVIGGYYEDVVAQLLSEHDIPVLGAAIFGDKPNAAQLAAVANCMPLTFSWAPTSSAIYSFPGHLGRATLATNTAVPEYAWGFASSAESAFAKTQAEAIERQAICEPRDLIEARMAELPSAVDPRECLRYSAAQHRQQDFPYSPFQPDAAYRWVTASAWKDGATAYALADLVYSARALRTAGYTPRHTFANTSGCAAGRSPAEAQASALLELLERDAFMRHWLTQTPGVEIEHTSLPADSRVRLERIGQAGCAVGVYSLKSAFCAVIMVCAQHEQAGITCLGAAARFGVEAALSAALDELETRVFAVLNASPIKRPDFRAVRTPKDHAELYMCRAYFRRADRLLKNCEEIPFQALSFGRATDLESMACAMIDAGLSPVFADITPRQAGVKQGRAKLVVVRAMAPGLIPLTFGYGLEPRGMLSVVHAGSKFPHPFP